MKSIRSHILKAVTAVIALVLVTGSLAACRQEKKDYATGYPIEVKKHDRNVLDKWDIRIHRLYFLNDRLHGLLPVEGCWW